ncbi:IS3 family transposase [Nitrosomonas communis]|nr:IS3 family transposase [Nitrosomonas communis]
MIDTLRQQYPVALMCRVLEVSESGFPAWNIRPPCEREQKNARLVIEILAAHQRTRETYGVKRLHSELIDQGVQITAYRVRVLRKKLNLRRKQKRKFKVTTDSKHHLPFAPNILKREFAVSAPGKAWVSDISVPQQAA